MSQRQHPVDRLQHEAVAAERHDHRGLLQRTVAVSRNQSFARCCRQRRRGGAERDAARNEAPCADNLQIGVEIVQTRFRCSSTGMSRRTRAVTLWSIRAVAQPVPSDTLAVTWPHGSTIIEWP